MAVAAHDAMTIRASVLRIDASCDSDLLIQEDWKIVKALLA
jgi:hypothetical protein